MCFLIAVSGYAVDMYAACVLSTTVTPRQEATRLIGERPNLYSENVIQLISHPQGEATVIYKPRLVGEHR